MPPDTPRGLAARSAAVARCASLVEDDRLLQAARLADAAGLRPPLVLDAHLADADADPGPPPDEESESDESRPPRLAHLRLLDRFLPKARRMRALLASLKSDPNAPGNDWIVQGEHMGRRDVNIYYRVDEETKSKLTARIESPIARSVLVPFLSVLNESELYAEWLPNWTVPRLRVRRSVKLAQSGRCSQVVLVTVDLPWPFSAREAVLDACGVDDIDGDGDICVLVRSLPEEDAEGAAEGSRDDTAVRRDGEEHEENSCVAEEEGPSRRREAIEIPAPDESDVVRIGFEGGFLFRAVPREWWSAKRKGGDAAKKKASSASSSSSWFSGGWGESAAIDDTAVEEERGDSAAAPDAGDSDSDPDHPDSSDSDSDKILVSVQMFIDPKIPFVPATLMHFMTRTVLYTMWCMLLRVAEGVRDGKMPKHAAAIEAKRETLYDWTRERCGVMLARLFERGAGGGEGEASDETRGE